MNLLELQKEIEFDLPKNDEQFIALRSFVPPSTVIDAINSVTKMSHYAVSTLVEFKEAILRTNKLVFQPLGHLSWNLSNVSLVDNQYIIIAADEIVINSPDNISDIAILDVRSPLSYSPYFGKCPDQPEGITGSFGYDGRPNTGESGGNGGHGLQGILGNTYNYPLLLIFYKKITINNANPSVTDPLSIVGKGITGGNGGQGGKGGKAGNGGRGTPGARVHIGFGFYRCGSGPGRGGNTGKAGSGGKGGKAGKGGDGLSIVFLGPLTYEPKIDFIKFELNKGQPGHPGQPGNDGDFGQEGGGGDKPFECPQGASSGDRYTDRIPNPDKAFGDSNVEGDNGKIFKTTRANLDI